MRKKRRVTKQIIFHLAAIFDLDNMPLTVVRQDHQCVSHSHSDGLGALYKLNQYVLYQLLRLETNLHNTPSNPLMTPTITLDRQILGKLCPGVPDYSSKI